MSFYKGLAYLVYLESLSRVMHSIDSGSEKRSSDIVDLVHVLIFLMSKKERSVSAPLIDKVHATRRRQWMFGKASTSHTPSASRRLLASSFSADCHSLPSSQLIPKGFGKWKVILVPKQHDSTASDSSRVLLTMIEGTR